MTAETHDAATCPAFGGCADCRTAKFEAASPDIVFRDGLTDSQAAAFMAESRPPADGARGSADWLASLRQDLLAPAPEADPVDYSDVPAFNAAADRSLALAGATYMQRGEQYLDTWALEGQNTPFLDSVLRDLDVLPLSKSAKRLVMVAAMADIKLSRLGGAWKADTCLDLINYVAALTAWRESA